ncbi:helix-turn-helix domain-containing protein [Streptomyces chumphonensis]|uniref:helix-turn-helix domain-containing protein n=1 Tax=Streptomyces chumphonensis TaxID=1214925 RepID=UPI003D739A80
MTTRPMLTQREAAAACGVSRTTIRRRREAGELPGAVLDELRGWLIPVDDLLAAGFRLHAPAPPDADTGATAGPVSGGREDAGRDQAAELERERHRHALELAAAELRAELAEARADQLEERVRERGEHIEDLQRALAALMPAPDRPSIPQPTREASPAQPAAAPAGPAAGEENTRPEAAGSERRRWWQRR